MVLFRPSLSNVTSVSPNFRVVVTSSHLSPLIAAYPSNAHKLALALGDI